MAGKERQKPPTVYIVQTTDSDSIDEVADGETRYIIEHDYSLKMPSVESKTTSQSLPVVTARGKKCIKMKSESNLVRVRPSPVTAKFAKCEKCRKSRTKIRLPSSILALKMGQNDGKTCDFCGIVIEGQQQTAKIVKKEKKAKKRVPCPQCHKEIFQESMSKHIRDVHTNVSRVECDICHKELAGTFSLKEHKTAVHDKVLNHPCPQCEKKFASKSNLSRHVRVVHDKQVVSNTYTNCQICFKCVLVSSIKKHIESVHQKKRDHICSYCNKGFTQSYNLKEHIQSNHTKEFDHKCKTCGKEFAHRTNAVRHAKTRHKSTYNEVIIRKSRMSRILEENLDDEESK